VSDIPSVYWRLVLCDLAGTPISMLSYIALGKQLQFPLNRPASLSFNVASESPLVNIIYSGDGYGEPFLTCGIRTVRAYRKVAGVAGWVLRFNGIVWQLQDQGNTDTVSTAVTAYDPSQLLTKRLVRSADGNFSKPVILSGQHGEVIAKALVDRSATYAGPLPIDTVSGTFTSSAVQTKTWEQSFVGPALVDLCNTGTLDVWFDPTVGADGVLAVMNAGPRRGQDRPNMVMAYAAPGHTALSIDRTTTMETVANAITLWAGSTTGHKVHVSDTPSQTKYYVYEDAQVMTDIHTPAFVDNLATEDLALRKDPRDVLTLLPIPERSPMPWRDYFLGDKLSIQVSKGSDQTFPSARESISGLLRVYGLTISIDDDGVERVTGVDVSPQ
jgi:hypothetical protein